MKIKNILNTTLSVLLLTTSTSIIFASQIEISESSLGLRNSDLFMEKTEKTPSKTNYSQSYPGTSVKFKRAFQDAPPMIPHNLEGILPITINSNQCLGCHMPDVASSMGSTPIPVSHFTNFRPLTTILKDGSLAKSGKAIGNTSSESLENVSIEENTKLIGARFNCTQCHAPQSDGEIRKNNFEAKYLKENGQKKSSWSGVNLMEGINTLGK